MRVKLQISSKRAASFCALCGLGTVSIWPTTAASSVPCRDDLPVFGTVKAMTR